VTVEGATPKAEAPAVSIVIPCYNHAEFLPEAIGSVAAQTHDDWEIVVVDDGSDYEDRRLIQRHAEGHRLVRQRNKGLPAARNAGIREARGTYVVCLDADDRLLPEYLERALPLAGPNTVVAPGIRMFGDRDESFAPIDPRVPADPWGTPNIFYVNNMFQSSLYPKALWSRVGGYDESMRDGYEDWEFWIRLVKTRAEFRLIAEPLYEYRIRAGSMITDAESKHARILAYMAAKHPEMRLR
jgi:glycosyltransferase involved in cell wall biosynthesis